MLGGESGIGEVIHVIIGLIFNASGVAFALIRNTLCAGPCGDNDQEQHIKSRVQQRYNDPYLAPYTPPRSIN